MTPEQRTFFRVHGYLHLRGAVARRRLRPLQDRVLGELRRLGISTSRIPAAIKTLPPFQQIGRLSQLLNIPEFAESIVPPEARDAISALAETRVLSQQYQLLVSPPNQGAWSLQGLNWHTDLSGSNGERMPGIQAFVLLDDVSPRGGATRILSGSHLRARSEEPMLRDALRRNREEERSQLPIVELAGNAGDVYLMDMRVLHTPSINTSKRFRLVATVRFFLE